MGLIGGGIQALAGIGMAGVGLIQSHNANKRLDALLRGRPQYNIQSEYGQNQTLANNVRDMYGRMTNTSDLPGQAQMENRLAQNSANATGSAAMNGVNNPAQLAQLANSTLQNQNQSTVDLDIAGAENRNRNITNFANSAQGVEDANTAMAEEKDKAWNYNINEPYQNKVGTERKKLQVGQSNVYKGFDMGVAGAMSAGDSVGKTAMIGL